MYIACLIVKASALPTAEARPPCPPGESLTKVRAPAATVPTDAINLTCAIGALFYRALCPLAYFASRCVNAVASHIPASHRGRDIWTVAEDHLCLISGEAKFGTMAQLGDTSIPIALGGTPHPMSATPAALIEVVMDTEVVPHAQIEHWKAFAGRVDEDLTSSSLHALHVIIDKPSTAIREVVLAAMNKGAIAGAIQDFANVRPATPEEQELLDTIPKIVETRLTVEAMMEKLELDRCK
jgi:hypothetical protein